jgi:hypothetical protein
MDLKSLRVCAYLNCQRMRRSVRSLRVPNGAQTHLVAKRRPSSHINLCHCSSFICDKGFSLAPPIAIFRISLGSRQRHAQLADPQAVLLCAFPKLSDLSARPNVFLIIHDDG